MAVVEPAARRGDVTVAAVAARRAGSAAAFAAEHGITTAYDSYEALIADPGVDVVYNALPPHLHAELSIMALEAGKHVLCEKPFAMDAEEARRMVEAGRRAGRRIIEAFHDRHHPVFLYLEDLVASGRLGRLTSLKAAFNHTIPHVEGERDTETARRAGARAGGRCRGRWERHTEPWRSGSARLPAWAAVQRGRTRTDDLDKAPRERRPSRGADRSRTMAQSRAARGHRFPQIFR
jgi:hypothetical protein